MLKYSVICLLLISLVSIEILPNNVIISNVIITGQNITEHYAYVQFDVSWDNSFRDEINWDACWIFIKYRIANTNLWHHATLSTSGHNAPIGSTISTPSDGKGVFIYRSANGNGTFSINNVQLRWNYGAEGIADNATLTLKVVALEMVYVTEGTFAVGDGYNTAFNFPLTTINTPDARVAPSGTGELGGMAGGFPSTYTLPSNSDWPNGYNAFYCMKYEMTQEQYADFLNTLTYLQQANRTTSAPNSDIGTGALTLNYRNAIKIQVPGVNSTTPATYACDLINDGNFNQSNDGLTIACNYLNWGDVAAYLDWAGLRPMTEMEYEKACRGHNQFALGNELAWGISNFNYNHYTLENAGYDNEGIATNYSTIVGNATTVDNNNSYGPFRVGIFAANVGNTGRMTAGASYYGIMEMTGNVLEQTVKINHLGYQDMPGDGELDVNGFSNTVTWPGSNAQGTIGRGGSFIVTAGSAHVSNRAYNFTWYEFRNVQVGCRGVRTAP